MASIAAVMEDVAAWKTLTHADASARGEAAVWRLGEEPRCVGSSSRRRREAEVMCRRYFSCGGGGWGSSTRRHKQVDCGVDGRGGGVIATAFGAAVMVESWWIHLCASAILVLYVPMLPFAKPNYLLRKRSGTSLKKTASRPITTVIQHVPFGLLRSDHLWPVFHIY